MSCGPFWRATRLFAQESLRSERCTPRKSLSGCVRFGAKMSCRRARSIGNSVRGFVVSIAFWSCLFAAAACFAAVSLAPKYVTWLSVAVQHADNQRRLVVLERQMLQLKEVVSALRTGSGVCRGVCASGVRRGSTRRRGAAVAPELRLDPQRTGPLAASASRLFPPWFSIVAVLAQDRPLRTGLLVAAATLVIVAFTFLHEPVSRRFPRQSAPTAPNGKSDWHLVMQHQGVRGQIDTAHYEEPNGYTPVEKCCHEDNLQQPMRENPPEMGRDSTLNEPGDDMISELRLRQWARRNYLPPEQRHSRIASRCARRNGASRPGTRG